MSDFVRLENGSFLLRIIFKSILQEKTKYRRILFIHKHLLKHTHTFNQQKTTNKNIDTRRKDSNKTERENY